MSAATTTSSARVVRELLSRPDVTRACEYVRTSSEKIDSEHIAICSVPASPFAETERAEYLRQRFSELELAEVSVDSEGNCIGLRKGTQEGSVLVVSAHLDTVFPIGTNFTVKTVGERFLAPGIGDDGAGLAALLAIAKAMNVAGIETQKSILFVGTVGEEGEGNLRGVRHLLTQSVWANRIGSFISFDGSGLQRITNRALGSRRYSVVLTGPGGHSWGDFGLPNPVHALGRAIARIASYPAPLEPRTTLNVGKIEGGTSINSIPDRASMEVDLRSTDEGELRRLDAYFRRAVSEAVSHENEGRRSSDPDLDMKVRLIGERPTGETAPNSKIVELCQEATRAVGGQPRLDQASTDSNLPISLGIPAVTLGAGGRSGCSHTLEEWYEPQGRAEGLIRGLLVILGLVGLQTS